MARDMQDEVFKICSKIVAGAAGSGVMAMPSATATVDIDGDGYADDCELAWCMLRIGRIIRKAAAGMLEVGPANIRKRWKFGLSGKP